jgi:hypothetical protein
MYVVEYLYDGAWRVSLTIGSKLTALWEANRLSKRYLVRISGPDIAGYEMLN